MTSSARFNRQPANAGSQGCRISIGDRIIDVDRRDRSRFPDAFVSRCTPVVVSSETPRHSFTISPAKWIRAEPPATNLLSPLRVGRFGPITAFLEFMPL